MKMICSVITVNCITLETQLPSKCSNAGGGSKAFAMAAG